MNNPTPTGKSVRSRANPSPRYRELLEQYRRMHEEGEQHQKLLPEDTYPGKSLNEHVAPIKALIVRDGAKSLLDYGAGKGLQYSRTDLILPDGSECPSIQRYWGIDRLVCYDPGHLPFSKLPEGQFDGVICTDVLEHCDQADVQWIIEEMFGYSRRFVYANIACYPAQAILPNGENAHCTIKPPEWWQAKIDEALRRHPAIRYTFVLDIRKPKPFGRKSKQKVILEN